MVALACAAGMLENNMQMELKVGFLDTKTNAKMSTIYRAEAEIFSCSCCEKFMSTFGYTQTHLNP